MTVQLVRRRFTAEEYHCMAQAGILGEDDRVELIEGEIVEMAPIGSQHQAHVDRLTRLFDRLVGERAIVRVQGPVRLGEHSEPQPDVTLLRPRPDFYASAHPGPQDVLLVIKVVQSSQEYDREVKVPLYARFGIPEVWLVDLERQVVEVFRRPSSEGYQDTRLLQRDQSLSAQRLPELSVLVSDVLV